MIGIFDSGHGGLTVLQALVAAAPRRPFLYFGDHGNAPYGNRPREEIYRLTCSAVERMFGLGCRLVVLACNTAASTSLRRLQQEWLPAAYPEHRVLGVLVPMVEAITGVPWMADLSAARRTPRPHTVAVFATRQTVASDAYPVEIGKRAPEITVVQQACPHLVDRIEAGAERAELAEMVGRYVGELMARLPAPPEAAMLGCTHYPLIADLFAQALPAGVEILSQPDLVARSLEAYLARHPQFEETAAEPGLAFYTSGDPATVSRLASRFIGQPMEFAPLPEGMPGRKAG